MCGVVKNLCYIFDCLTCFFDSGVVNDGVFEIIHLVHLPNYFDKGLNHPNQQRTPIHIRAFKQTVKLVLSTNCYPTKLMKIRLINTLPAKTK